MFKYIAAILLIILSNACDASCDQCMELPNLCIHCASKYIWDGDVCIQVVPREIPGYGRDCVECGEGNYPGDDFKCHPCKFNCKKCDSKDTCEKCESTFVLNPDTLECECKYGGNLRLFNGKCYCQEENTYITLNDDGEPECHDCGFTTRQEDGCPTDCPDGYYDLDGLDCIPCNSRCSKCSGGGELTCNGCNSPFEFVDSVSMCMCPCCTIEIKGDCVPLDGMTLVDGVCIKNN